MIRDYELKEFKCPRCNSAGDMHKTNHGTTVINWYGCYRCFKDSTEKDLLLYNGRSIVSEIYKAVYKKEMTLNIPYVESCKRCPLSTRYEESGYSWYLCPMLYRNVTLETSEITTTRRHPECPMTVNKIYVGDKLIKTTIETKEGIKVHTDKNNILSEDKGN